MLRFRPPVALVALLAFGSGLGLGLVAGGAAPGVALLAAAAVAVIARARPPAMALALLFGAGVAHGRVARWYDAGSCAARLPTGVVGLAVRVAEPTSGRVPAQVVPVGAGCRGAISVRFGPADRVRAGDAISLRGRWLPAESGAGRARGLLVAHGVQPVRSQPGRLDRLRNWLHDASRSLYGHRAGLVEALILGRRGGIDPALQAAFARAGLVHILAISGLHVGLIAGWLFLLLRLARVARHRAAVAATVAVTAYVVFIGAPPSALRAVVLTWVLTLETGRQRRARPGSLFAVTGLLLLAIEPFALTELGAWLSLAAVAGVSAFARWGDAAFGRRGPVRILCGSIGATAATAPITAMALGTVSLIGIPLNLVAIPLAGLAVPGVLLSLLSRGVSLGAAESVATGAGLLLDVLERVAMAGARVPGAALDFSAGAVAAALAVAALAAAGWVIAGRSTAREAARRGAWLVAAVLVGTLGRGLPWPTHAGSVLTLHFLNVGQGDAAVIRTPSGHWVLVDAGPRTEQRDAGRDVVVPFLTRHGVRRLDVLVVSHPHLDHLGGAAAVLERIGAGVVLEPGRAAPEPAYRSFLDAVERAGARWVVARAGDHFVIDGVSFEVLHPDTAWAGYGADLNEDSVVLRIRAGRFEAVLSGDAGLPVESLLRGRVGRADVLKVGHHGSRTATGSAWLSELGPAVAVVSVGANRYGHPAPAALARLDSARAEVWRTDRDGTITVLVEATKMQVRGRTRAVWHPLD